MTGLFSKKSSRGFRGFPNTEFDKLLYSKGVVLNCYLVVSVVLGDSSVKNEPLEWHSQSGGVQNKFNPSLLPGQTIHKRTLIHASAILRAQ